MSDPDDDVENDIDLAHARVESSPPFEQSLGSEQELEQPGEDEQTVPKTAERSEGADSTQDEEGASNISVDQVLSGGDVTVGRTNIITKTTKTYNKESTKYEHVKDQSSTNIRSEESLFVPTRFYHDAIQRLRARGLLVICGPPGSGKTSLGRAVLRFFKTERYIPLVLHSYDEWRRHVKGKPNHIVLVDSLFGEACVNQTTFEEWRKTFADMTEYARQSECLVVIIMYTHILREIQERVDDFKEEYVLDLASSPGLSPEEKREMIKKHLEAKGMPVTEETVEEILSSDKSGPVFPWCLKKHVEGTESSDSSSVLQNPARAFTSLLKTALNDKENGQCIAAVLLLIMKSKDGCLKLERQVKEEITALGLDCSVQAVQAMAKRYMESYFSSEKQFPSSPTIHDTAVLALGASDYLHTFLSICDTEHLTRYVHTENRPERHVLVKVERGSAGYNHLECRVYEELVNRNFQEIFQHPSLQSEAFWEDFKLFVRKQNGNLHDMLTATDLEHGESLLYWSGFCSFTAVTQWCMRQMLEQNVDQKHLARCAIRMLFVCILCGDRITCEKVKDTLAILRTLPQPEAMTRISLPLLSAEQSFTIDVQERCNRFQKRLETGTSYCPGEQLIPVPETFMKIERSERVVHVDMPGNYWYLALRLLADRQVDERDDEGNTLLHVAADTGDLDVVKIAVKSGASLTARNNKRQTPVCLARLRMESKASPNSQEARVLAEACTNGDLETVKACLCHEVSVCEVYSSDNCKTPLHVACESGKEMIASLLIRLGADVNAKNVDKCTPLHLSCINGHLGTTNLLLRSGAFVNEKNFTGVTPLHDACSSGYADLASALLSHGAGVNTKSIYGWAALHFACRNGLTPTAALLLEKKADVNISDNNRATPLHLAAEQGHEDTVDLLIRNHANVNAADSKWFTPLHLASERGHLSTVRRLVNCGVDVLRKTDSGCTPLHLACNGGHTHTADVLINERCIDAKDNSMSTPLHAACRSGNTDTAALLLERGASVESTNKDGSTALTLACLKNDTRSAMLLLRNRADASKGSRFGLTPLHIACFMDNTEIVTSMLEIGADVNMKTARTSVPRHLAKDEDSRAIADLFQKYPSDFERAALLSTPLQLMCLTGGARIAECLVSHRADVTHRNNAGFAPLHVASYYGHLEIIKLLLNTGIDINMVASDGSTAMHMACKGKQLDAVELLMDKKGHINVADNSGSSPLREARKARCQAIYDLLIERGAVDDRPLSRRLSSRLKRLLSKNNENESG